MKKHLMADGAMQGRHVMTSLMRSRCSVRGAVLKAALLMSLAAALLLQLDNVDYLKLCSDCNKDSTHEIPKYNDHKSDNHSSGVESPDTVTEKQPIRAGPTAPRDQPPVSIDRNFLLSQGQGQGIAKSYPRWWVIIQDGEQSCADVAELLSKQWAILVTGVHKTTHIPLLRCFYVNADDVRQEAEEAHTTIIAELYLKAIAQGAEAIYVARDSTSLQDVALLDKHIPDFGVRKLFIERNNSAEVNFETLTHFGCHHGNTGDMPDPSFTYTLCTLDYPAIITPLVTRRYTAVNETLVCDRLAPMATAHKGTYVDLDLQGSLFFKDAFWALPLSVTMATGLWESVVQWVLWKQGAYVGVWSGKDTLTATPRPSTAANLDPDFIHKLSAVQCLPDEEWSISLCVRKVLVSLTSYEILSAQDTELLRKWFFRLMKHVQYDLTGEVTQTQCLPSLVQYQPIIAKQREDTTSVKTRIQLAKKKCAPHLEQQSLNNIFNLINNNARKFDDMLLIVIFNNAFYSTIPYIELLLRAFWPNILYCGPDTMTSSERVSYVSFGANVPGYRPGSFNYRCVVHAYSMYPYMPGGYFITGDDILLLPHLVSPLPLDSVWFEPRIERFIVDFDRKCPFRDGKCDTKTYLPPELKLLWFTEYPNESLTVLNDMRTASRTSPRMRRCYRQLLDNHGGARRIASSYSDLYHIPQTLIVDFAYLAEFFLQHKVYLDLAVPTIIASIEAENDVIPAAGLKSWNYKIRDRPWLYIQLKDLKYIFYHPTKWGYMDSSSNPTAALNYTIFYCNVLDQVFDKFKNS